MNREKSINNNYYLHKSECGHGACKCGLATPLLSLGVDRPHLHGV